MLTTATAITLAGVFPVWDEGLKETISKDGSIERTVLCLWEARLQLYAALGATSQSIGGVNVGSQVGISYPPLPWFGVSEITMDRADGQGGNFVDSHGVVGSKYARLKIVYRPIPPVQLVGGVAQKYSIALDFGHQIIAVKGGGFTMDAYSAARLPDDHYLAIRVPLISIKISALGQATFPMAAVQTAVAAPLNSATFLGLFPPDTVLFDGARTRAAVTAQGASNWDEDLHFIYRGKPWNQIYFSGDATHAPGWTALTPDPYVNAKSNLMGILP